MVCHKSVNGCDVKNQTTVESYYFVFLDFFEFAENKFCKFNKGPSMHFFC